MENESLSYNFRNKKFISSLEILEGSEGQEKRIEIILKENVKKIDGEVDIEVEETLKEFLYKLIQEDDYGVLRYHIKKPKLEIKNIFHDEINITDSLNKIYSLPKQNELKNIIEKDIKFKKNKKYYQKIINLLDILNPIIKFLTLYDFFLELLTDEESEKLKKNKKNKGNKNNTFRKYQCKIIDYIRKNKEELEKRTNIEYTFKISLRGQIKKEEDILTALRNDIGHSNERIDEKEIYNLEKRATKLVIPLVSVITYYLSNRI